MLGEICEKYIKRCFTTTRTKKVALSGGSRSDDTDRRCLFVDLSEEEAARPISGSASAK